MGTIRKAAIAVLVAVTLAGCSATVSGTAVPEGASPAGNSGALDTGSYPTTPQAPLGNAATYEVGQLVEGRRMAGFVVGPWQVDPTLIKPKTTSASVVTKHERLGLWPTMTTLMPPMVPLIVGFVAERQAADNEDSTSLRNMVVRYRDSDAATAVARGMLAGAFIMPVPSGASIEPIPTEPIRPVAIPRHEGVTGALLTRDDGTQMIQELIVPSTRGPFVLVQDIQTTGGQERAAELAAKTLDLQGPLIDKFQPTDPAKFSTLALDPTGLVARTVPLKASQATTMSNAAFDAAGGLQLEDDPAAAASAYTDSAVDAVSNGQTVVYQTRDAGSAQRLAQTLGDNTAKSPGAKPAPVVSGLPQSRCVQIIDSGGLVTRYWCIATADRYAFRAVAREYQNAAQQLAAQFRMLTR